jgi:hypothetical protein
MRLRAALVAVGAGALVLLGACGGNQGNQPAGGQPPGDGSTLTIVPPSEPSTGPGVPPADAIAIPGNQLDFTALPEGYPKQAWTVGEGRILPVQAQEGGCGKASAEVTEQSDTKVLITLVETRPAQSEMCTMDIRYPIVSVTLDKPLANRTVVLRAEQRRA